MALTRLMQLCAKVETTPGTLEPNLFVAANAAHLVIDPSINYEIPLFTRNIKRGTLTSIEGLTGIKTANCSFQLEMSGDSNATPDVPTWDLFMRSAGFTSRATSSLTLAGAITGGPFRHGETITGGTSGATAKVLHDTYESGGTLYIDTISIGGGPFEATGEVITGGTSGAIATTTAASEVDDVGQTWYPISFPTVVLNYGTLDDPTVGEVITGSTSGAVGVCIAKRNAANSCDVRVYNGLMYTQTEAVTGDLTFSETLTSAAQQDIPTLSLGLIEDGVGKLMKGARANWQFTANIGEPAVMTFEFVGAAHTTITDEQLIAENTITYESAVPPVFLGASMILGSEGDTSSATDYLPRLSTVSVNMNSDVQMRQSVNEASGLLHAELTARDASGSMDPELDLESSYGIMTKFLAGSIMRTHFTVGSTAGNKFYFTIPGMQATSMNTGDRTGISTREFAFRATGGHKTNASSALGSDNEIVITYLL